MRCLEWVRETFPRQQRHLALVRTLTVKHTAVDDIRPGTRPPTGAASGGVKMLRMLELGMRANADGRGLEGTGLEREKDDRVVTFGQRSQFADLADYAKLRDTKTAEYEHREAEKEIEELKNYSWTPDAHHEALDDLLGNLDDVRLGKTVPLADLARASTPGRARRPSSSAGDDLPLADRAPTPATPAPPGTAGSSRPPPSPLVKAPRPLRPASRAAQMRRAARISQIRATIRQASFTSNLRETTAVAGPSFK